MKINLTDLSDRHIDTTYNECKLLTKKDILEEFKKVCESVKEDFKIDLNHLSKMVRNNRGKHCLSEFTKTYDSIFIVFQKDKEIRLGLNKSSCVINAKRGLYNTEIVINDLFNLDTGLHTKLTILVDSTDSCQIFGFISNFVFCKEYKVDEEYIMNFSVGDSFTTNTKILTLSKESLNNPKEKVMGKYALLELTVG